MFFSLYTQICFYTARCHNITIFSLIENDSRYHLCYTLVFLPVQFDAMIKITEFVQGDHLRLVDFGQTEVLYRRRLLSLGITRGVLIDVVRVAPLGCPVQIEVRGTALTLRKAEACHLQWERV